MSIISIIFNPCKLPKSVIFLVRVDIVSKIIKLCDYGAAKNAKFIDNSLVFIRCLVFNQLPKLLVISKVLALLSPASITTIFIHVAGDMGGYLGLLIGASIITLCEILDLIFYNIAVKLLGKKKDTNGREHDVEMVPQEVTQ